MRRDAIDLHASEIAATIPDELIPSDTLLRQYGEWASRRGSRGAPGTLDRMYRRESDGRESREAYAERCSAVPKDPPMTTPDAMSVQRALIRVPDKERVVLQVLYVPQRLPPHAQLRILRITPQLSRIRHLEGLRLFTNIHRVGTIRAT